ncbi:response regulator [Paenibacillaceae bacterium WGS1546]|uniref:response regulator transcription factor n=1 Tax=Cohnella sp. WGS1546 TaxID=3366810 RepID=UPI00372D5C50
MKVIVVDDEVFVRKGIMTGIPWLEHGIDIAGEASNGLIGLELVRQLSPHVVLTDLRMPVMDGLEMIRHIRDEYPEIKIIIMSVREDFQAVQEALRLGVADYIHKLHLNPADLLHSLLKIKASIQDPVPSTLPASSLPDVSCSGLWRWLKDTSTESEQEVFVDASNYLLVKVQLHNGASMTDPLNKLFLETLLDRLNLKSVWEHSVWLFDDRGDLWIWMHSNESLDRESVSADLEELLDAIRKRDGDLLVSAGLSLPFHIKEDRITAARQAEEALERCFHRGYGAIHLYEVRHAVDREPQPLFEPSNLKKYLHSMGILDFDKAEKQLMLLFPAVVRIDIPESIVREGVYQWLSSNVALLRERIGYIHDGILDKSPFEQISVIRTYGELREWCLRFHTVTREMLQKMNAGPHRHEIRKAIDFIHECYAQPIRVQDVAQYVHLSENYFSYLFSKETGKPFIHYLQEFRVEKAKDLFRKGRLPWTDIGAAVGFENQKYFSKIFKRYTEMTPAQYSNRIRWNGSKSPGPHLSG